MSSKVWSRHAKMARPALSSRIDVSPDGRVYRFTLRHGIRFHNGATFTSADVVWSWRRYLDPKTGWLCLPLFDGSRGAKLESVTAPDAYSVEFRLDRPEP